MGGRRNVLVSVTDEMGARSDILYVDIAIGDISTPTDTSSASNAPDTSSIKVKLSLGLDSVFYASNAYVETGYFDMRLLDPTYKTM